MSGKVNSANFAYWAFCELRSDGVLRSSAWRCGPLQGKEGYVVLLLPPLPHEGVELLHQELPQRFLLISVMGNKLPKPREAEHLAFRVMGLYQPIAVEEHVLALP